MTQRIHENKCLQQNKLKLWIVFIKSSSFFFINWNKFTQKLCTMVDSHDLTIASEEMLLLINTGTKSTPGIMLHKSTQIEHFKTHKLLDWISPQFRTWVSKTGGGEPMSEIGSAEALSLSNLHDSFCLGCGRTSLFHKQSLLTLSGKHRHCASSSAPSLAQCNSKSHCCCPPTTAQDHPTQLPSSAMNGGAP